MINPQNILIHKFIPTSKVEGPGTRAVLWVQGCTIKCKGCAVPHTWSFNKEKACNIETLSKKILNLKDKIQGITVFGGEPFDQAKPLYTLLKKIKDQSSLSVMVFSGYTYEYLTEGKNIYYKKLLGIIDLFVDGPYIEKLTDLSRPWIGSSNQRFFFLTDTYAHLKNEFANIKNKIEIKLDPNGEVTINGLVKKEVLQQIKKTIQHS